MKFLVIDNHAEVLDAIIDMLSELSDHEVIGASDALEATKILYTSGPGVFVVFLDPLLPNIDGTRFLQRLQSGNFAQPRNIILTSADARWGGDIYCEGVRLEPVDWFLSKPFSMSDVETLLLKLKAM